MQRKQKKVKNHEKIFSCAIYLYNKYMAVCGQKKICRNHHGRRQKKSEILITANRDISLSTDRKQDKYPCIHRDKDNCQRIPPNPLKRIFQKHF